ncbi:MAG: DUF4384 domain-containing protein, partial [Pseudomonadales bacterium]|nr:DUF4384 domain-containing protein [Pseudomonadales bacterium]
MRKLAFLLMLVVLPHYALAGQSSITEADGESCMGDDKSRKQTEDAALADAKRLAIEYTSTHVSSTTVVENFQLKQDLVEAFNRANVKVLNILDEKWADPAVSDCYTIRIKAEVVPVDDLMKKVDNTQSMADPRLPLNVNVWVDSQDQTYEEGQDVTVYLQGNKPFYARLIYTDASGNNIQILPNQHRSDNYFAGATILEIPEAKDKFLLTVTPPFGKEKLTLYASTSPLGGISTTKAGGDVYAVNEAPEAIPAKTRGISIQAVSTEEKAKKQSKVAEFAESSVEITTKP